MPSVDFDLADWADLPPLDEADLPAEPPPEREHTGGITVGSDLAAVLFTEPGTADLGAVELGAAVGQGFASAHPGLVELARLGSVGFDSLGAVGRVDALIAVDRQQAWLEARKQELLAAIELQDRSADHWCVEEVGAALRLSGGAARTLLADAEQLVIRLPGTLAALSGGQLNRDQATAITRGSYPLPDDLLPTFETRVLARADGQSVTGLKRSITRTVLALDPATAEQKHHRARQDRHVRITPAEHGMAWLAALLPAEDARAIYDQLTSTAKTTARNNTTGNNDTAGNNTTGNNNTARNTTAGDNPDGGDGGEEGRTVDQLRADLLTAAVLAGLHHDLPQAPGHRPRVSVVISLTTLVEKDDDPGWLDGYGPITAGHARRIAHDPTGTWRRLITDPATGQLLDYGTTRYRPPPHLTDHITTRDAECTFPYCTHPARTTDLDHLQPYPTGSATATNLHPLHRRHHNAKTHAHWTPTRNPTTGTTHWTSPQHRHYQKTPPQRWTLPEPPPTEEPPPF